jgi:thiol:disulfide interchange protein DsbA
MEPAVEPALRDLLKRNIITLTLVDVPFSSHSALFARYFLYALKAKNDFEHALMVRNTLFEATGNRDITTAEKIEELFKSKGIPYSAFEPRSAFERYNALIKADKINATPSCVIIKGGKKETFIGGADIIRALNALK